MGFTLDYPNELWDVGVSGSQIGEDFRAALGFVPRRGIRKIRSFVTFQPRAPEIGMRRFIFEFLPVVFTDLEGRLLDYRIFTAPMHFVTESQERIEFNVIPEFQRLDEVFEIHPGVIIPPGDYKWTRYRAEISTANRRPWVAELSDWWGSFFSGNRIESNTRSASR